MCRILQWMQCLAIAPFRLAKIWRCMVQVSNTCTIYSYFRLLPHKPDESGLYGNWVIPPLSQTGWSGPNHPIQSGFVRNCLYIYNTCSFLVVAGFNNGQVLATLNSTVQGWCKSHLLFDYDEVPDPLINQDIAVSMRKPIHSTR